MAFDILTNNQVAAKFTLDILITGSTGFIGRPTVAYLQGKGYGITAWVRDLDKAKSLLGKDTKLIGPKTPLTTLRKELESVGSVIHLAGSPLAGVRWSKKKKKEFFDSRVGIAGILADQISKCSTPPSTFISANAVGFYGTRGSDLLQETSTKGNDFISTLCDNWESASSAVQKIGTRICTLRIGIVLGREGGLLKTIMPGFELGLGTYISTGEQIISWIHLLDVIRAIDFCLSRPNINGPINLTAPLPIKGKDFSAKLGQITGSKIMLPVPTLILKAFFGEGSKLLTASQNVSPSKLTENGFDFAYESLSEALRDEVTPKAITFNTVSSVPSISPVTTRSIRGNAYELKSRVSLNSNSANVFSFFSSPLNLGMVTPSWLKFQLINMPAIMDEKSEIVYRIKLGPFPIKWNTKIEKWKPTESLIDVQKQGPFTLWWHEHKLVATGTNSCIMEDKVLYKMPAGILGKIIHRLFVKRALQRIFGFRIFMMKLRFG